MHVIKMASKAEVEEALTNALKSKPKTVNYPDYDITQDFTQWLSGLKTRVRLAHGFELEEETKVEDEIVRSIAGMLEVGTALSAYDRLTTDEKKSYKLMVQRLTEEFIDPVEKRKFNERHNYNKREKGQSLKDYMQVIISDMDRYSDLPNEILVSVPGVGNAPATNRSIPNPEKEKQGVRRFRAGMRDAKGKKCKELIAHLRYNLVEDNQLTWKHAIKVASNWEMAFSDSSVSNNEKEEEQEEPNDGVEVVEVGSDGEEPDGLDCSSDIISALQAQIYENQMKIASIEAKQEELETTMKDNFAGIDNALQEIMVKLDACLAQADG